MGFVFKKINRQITTMQADKETSLKETLKYYCEKEIEKFVNSPICSKLKELVLSHKCSLELEAGKAQDEKDKNLYLSLSVVDSDSKVVEYFDDGFLTTSTMLVMVDKKDRLKFFSWRDEEFLEDLDWIINCLMKL